MGPAGIESQSELARRIDVTPSAVSILLSIRILWAELTPEQRHLVRSLAEQLTRKK